MGNTGITHYLLYKIIMPTTISKLTKKYQATIPEPVRKNLALQAGDSVLFDIQGEQVTLRKAQAVDIEYLQALQGTLSEWSSGADDQAYRDL